MGNTVDLIKAPIVEEMKLFENKFFESMKSNVSLLDRITHYIVRRKGKQMRPMFVFLSAKMLGEMQEKTYRAASFIELIHTATLVHDDVVDDSQLRRGFFSLNAIWKNKVAVLVGDYLLSKTLIISCKNKDFDLLEVVSTAIQELSEGELLQLEKARKLDITEDVYYEIIRMKTATLIAACCKAGALSVGVDEKVANKMHRFGELVGIAFQIKDDLFDYTTSNAIGKPVGIDIKEQKMTLPLIYTLNNVDEKDRKWLINSVKRYNNDKKRVREVIDFVKANGGIEYTRTTMEKYANDALDILKEMPDNEYRKSLELLVNYVMTRDK